MRFWLSESERRPDPAPARADARKARRRGHGGVARRCSWLSLRVPRELDAAGFGWFVSAAVTGVVLGLVGLVVVQVIRRRIARQEAGSAD